MTATEQYVNLLERLKPGELSLLREHAGRSLDDSLAAFDLFSGLWWPLRERNERAPRRGVAWVVSKLYASTPLENKPGRRFAWQLARCREDVDLEKDPVVKRFDRILTLPLSQIESALHWGLERISSHNLSLDWAKLTDDLSIWERESTRLRWAEEFLKPFKEDGNAH